MKQHINLFNYYHLSSRASRSAYKRIKKYLFYSIILLLLVIVGFQLVGLEIKNKIKTLEGEQEIILADTINTRNDDAGLDELVIKKKLIQQYLKDDVQFNTYYRLVQSYVADNAGAQLSQFKLDKDRETEIIIKFSTYDDYKRFVKGLENDAFIQNFDELIMGALPIENSAESEEMSITFNGSFKEINEKKI